MIDPRTEAASYKRPPGVVMRLERIGSFHATRISFMRSLIRRMNREKWDVTRTCWKMDADGLGEAVYTVRTPKHVYSLVAVSSALDESERTDRVIAEKWDAAFALVDGEPDAEDISRLKRCLPLQEAGRCSSREVVLSRANKSVRLFNYVVDCLARGEQPETDRLGQVGYLMRTTAVYGNGKFGMANRERIMCRKDMAGPYTAEMLTVYLIRCFTHDLVDHVARMRGGAGSVPLARTHKRILGIGNATGLGMAPYLHKHPLLINNWFDARETALARVRAIRTTQPDKVARFRELLARARQHVAQWYTDDARQTRRIETLLRELSQVEAKALDEEHPWHGLMCWAEENASVETQELLVSLLLEPHSEWVDDLENDMAADEHMEIDPSCTVGELRRVVETDYSWALRFDFDRADSTHWFWYVSEEKLEPRIGERCKEPGADREMPLGVARDVQDLHRDLQQVGDEPQSLALFLVRYPQHRHIARRLISLRNAPYGEIRDNLLDASMRPIDMLRSKLSFFGATKFDPKSDRWTRITMYQNAPLPDELHREDADDWSFPVIGGQEQEGSAHIAE